MPQCDSRSCLDALDPTLHSLKDFIFLLRLVMSIGFSRSKDKTALPREQSFQRCHSHPRPRFPESLTFLLRKIGIILGGCEGDIVRRSSILAGNSEGTTKVTS